MINLLSLLIGHISIHDPNLRFDVIVQYPSDAILVFVLGGQHLNQLIPVCVVLAQQFGIAHDE